MPFIPACPSAQLKPVTGGDENADPAPHVAPGKPQDQHHAEESRKTQQEGANRNAPANKKRPKSAPLEVLLNAEHGSQQPEKRQSRKSAGDAKPSEHAPKRKARNSGKDDSGAAEPQPDAKKARKDSDEHERRRASKHKGAHGPHAHQRACACLNALMTGEK